MAVIKFKKIEKPQILFGMILPQIVYDFYGITLNESSFERVIKDNLGIHPKRLVKLVEAVQGDGKEVMILVIYDKIVKGNAMLKEKIETEVKDFDFDIYNYDYNQEINIEFQIDVFSRKG